MSLLDLIQAFNPFMDGEGETYIEVEVEGTDRLGQIPLDTALARDIVKSQLCPLVKSGFPTDRDTRAAMDVLRGHAFTHPRRIAELSADYLIAKTSPCSGGSFSVRKGGQRRPCPSSWPNLMNCESAMESTRQGAPGQLTRMP